jgi:hypothetical protein
MTYKIYCGLVDFYILVETSSEEEAIRLGRERLIERIKEAELLALPFPAQDDL